MIDASVLYQKIVLAYVQFQDYKRSIPKRANVHFSSRELIYMHDIYLHPNSTISDCAKRSKVTIGTYTTIYKLLQKKALVEVKEKDHDKRVKLINLTTSGLKVVQTHLQAFQKLIEDMVADLGVKHFEDLMIFFDKVTKALAVESGKNLPKKR